LIDNGAQFAYKLVAPKGAITSEEKAHGKEKQRNEAPEEIEEDRSHQTAPPETLLIATGGIRPQGFGSASRQNLACGGTRGDTFEGFFNQKERAAGDEAAALLISSDLMHMTTRRKTIPSIDPHYAKFPLRVGRSQIHRFGVYTVETIPRGRKVIEYTGERLNFRQARARQKKAWSRGGTKIDALFGLNSFWTIDGAAGGSGAERINHCCDPNLKTRKIRGHIFYFSRRRIRPREELTVDYRFPAKADRAVCHCGSPKCRGTMNQKK
jgi:hypothetical protein